MRRIVGDCLRRNINHELICKGDHVGTRNLRACFVGYVVALDRAQNLRVCATDLFDRFVRITVDNGGQLKRTRLGKVLLALFEPGRGGLSPIERATFSMNDLASTFDKELCQVSC
jgi:hypothetical protein